LATSIFCIASSEPQAYRIIESLKAAGFSNNDISILFPDQGTTREFAHEKHTKAPEGATAGAGVGVAVGATLGWLAGIGMLAIPGVGPFIAAGPIMGALSGAAVAGTVGGLAGALVGMGVPEFEAKRYTGHIRGGNFLISAHSENTEENNRARDIFEQEGAEDICSAGESGKTADSHAASAH
jgi:hypothetical protein